jgi:hypothetical protein
MKKLVLLLVVLLIPANLFALKKITNEAQRQELAKAIRMNDYVCSSSNKANYIRQTTTGLVYQVFCNNDTFVFRVVLTPRDRYIAEPW